MRRRVLLAAVIGLSASGLTVLGAGSASATNTCDSTPWGNRVQGRPVNLHAHSRSGDYLWHNRTGFHLRATHKARDKRVYSGSITADGVFTQLKRIKLEAADKVWLSDDHKTLYFVLNNHGRIDGFDFRTACATTLTVSELKIGTSPLPRRQVYLGHYRSHPAQIPFTVHRKA